MFLSLSLSLYLARARSLFCPPIVVDGWFCPFLNPYLCTQKHASKNIKEHQTHGVCCRRRRRFFVFNARVKQLNWKIVLIIHCINYNVLTFFTSCFHSLTFFRSAFSPPLVAIFHTVYVISVFIFVSFGGVIYKRGNYLFMRTRTHTHI